MKKILVIDDDLMTSRLLHDHMINEGFSVQTATMGEEGFSAAVHETPDLIFLDVFLPDMTGFQLCGRLRQHAVTRALPIIMMTGSARYPNQQKIGRQIGANDYILKPFDVIKVGQKVRELLGLPAAVEPAVVDKPPVVLLPSSPPVVSPPLLKSEPIINFPESRPLSPMMPSPPAAKPMGGMPVLSSLSIEPVVAPSIKIKTEINLMDSLVSVLHEAAPHEEPAPVLPQAVPEDEDKLTLIPMVSLVKDTIEPVVAPIPVVPVPDPSVSEPAIERVDLVAAATSLPVEALPEPKLKPAKPVRGSSATEPIWYELALDRSQTADSSPQEVAAVPSMSYGTQTHLPLETPVRVNETVKEPEAATTAAHNRILNSLGAHEVESLNIPIKTSKPITRRSTPAWFSLRRLAWSLLALHALLFTLGAICINTQAGWVLRGVSFTLGGWVFLLGLLVGASTVLGISLSGEEAVEALGLMILPIVVRACAGVYTAFAAPKSFVHFTGESALLPGPIFWSHPLDIFQVLSLVIVGICLHRRLGASVEKSIGAATLMGVAWALLGRGYFKPF